MDNSAFNELANTIEAGGPLSLNDVFYGNLHGSGHILISLSHDPDNWFNVSTTGIHNIAS